MPTRYYYHRYYYFLLLLLLFLLFLLLLLLSFHKFSFALADLIRIFTHKTSHNKCPKVYGFIIHLLCFQKTCTFLYFYIISHLISFCNNFTPPPHLPNCLFEAFSIVPASFFYVLSTWVTLKLIFHYEHILLFKPLLSLLLLLLLLLFMLLLLLLLLHMYDVSVKGTREQLPQSNLSNNEDRRKKTSKYLVLNGNISP